MIKLESENIFELNLINSLKKFVEEGYYYQIIIKNDIINLKKLNYSGGINGTIVFDMENLKVYDFVNQKQEAIKLVYMYTFSKIGELYNRIHHIETITENGNFKSDYQLPYYIDETGNYPEVNIALSIRYTNPELYKGTNKSSNIKR